MNSGGSIIGQVAEDNGGQKFFVQDAQSGYTYVLSVSDKVVKGTLIHDLNYHDLHSLILNFHSFSFLIVRHFGALYL